MNENKCGGCRYAEFIGTLKGRCTAEVLTKDENRNDELKYRSVLPWFTCDNDKYEKR